MVSNLSRSSVFWPSTRCATTIFPDYVSGPPSPPRCIGACPRKKRWRARALLRPHHRQSRLERQGFPARRAALSWPSRRSIRTAFQGPGRPIDPGTATSKAFRGRIAQLVEQLTLNQRVASSSLAAPTIHYNDLGRIKALRRLPKLSLATTGQPRQVVRPAA